MAGTTLWYMSTMATLATHCFSTQVLRALVDLNYVKTVAELSVDEVASYEARLFDL